MNINDKAGVSHWNTTWAAEPRMRLPRPYTVSLRDRMALLRKEVRAGMTFLEIGCAPGKLLSWVGAALRARVSGLDYSEPGVQTTRKLMHALGIAADVRCEDVFQTTFEEGSFDVVHSAGVIEHFEDPREIVRIHTQLVKPGGLALISIPNLAGMYGRLATKETLAIHNLSIMNPNALKALAPPHLTASAESYHDGRFTLALGAIPGDWGPLAHLLRTASDMVGFAQPCQINALSPSLVLKIRRR